MNEQKYLVLQEQYEGLVIKVKEIGAEVGEAEKELETVMQHMIIKKYRIKRFILFPQGKNRLLIPIY